MKLVLKYKKTFKFSHKNGSGNFKTQNQKSSGFLFSVFYLIYT